MKSFWLIFIENSIYFKFFISSSCPFRKDDFCSSIFISFSFSPFVFSEKSCHQHSFSNIFSFGFILSLFRESLNLRCCVAPPLALELVHTIVPRDLVVVHNVPGDNDYGSWVFPAKIPRLNQPKVGHHRLCF